jgi:inositol phosphorylceramide mannosyltransferase catalytic subunit
MILGTEKTSRAFISNHYTWFLYVYDSYPYNIQRIDAIKYFVLYHYGGFYLDLDIGCRRTFETLRSRELVLAKTKPIGFATDCKISNPHLYLYN